MLRAVHQLLDGEPKILDDPAILRLLDPEAIEQIKANPARASEPVLSGLRAHVVLRSRFAEDHLQEAAARGVRQYVILGAGFDTFAYRQPEWAQSLRIFEVDHPATQKAKREQLNRAGISIPPNLDFVPIDFDSVPLREGLAPFLDFTRPAFFSCLGVLVYLSEEAVYTIFDLVASLPPSSEIAFTFSPPESALSPREASTSAKLAAVVNSMGEPWRTHFDPVALEKRLRDGGFKEIVFLDPAVAEERFFRGRTDGLRLSRRTNIASAVR